MVRKEPPKGSQCHVFILTLSRAGRFPARLFSLLGSLFLVTIQSDFKHSDPWIMMIEGLWYRQPERDIECHGKEIILRGNEQ